jgi:hypothetical protein
MFGWLRRIRDDDKLIDEIVREACAGVREEMTAEQVAGYLPTIYVFLRMENGLTRKDQRRWMRQN